MTAVILSGIAAGIWMVQDKEGPDIIFEEMSKEQYAIDVSETELLQGVTAIDRRDGDVTDSLIVEAIKIRSEESNIKVTYVAMDNSKNVTKITKIFSTETPIVDIDMQEETN